MISPRFDPLSPVPTHQPDPSSPKKETPKDEKLYKEMKQIFDFIVSTKQDVRVHGNATDLKNALRDRIQYSGSTGFFVWIKKIFFSIFKPRFNEVDFERKIRAFAMAQPYGLPQKATEGALPTPQEQAYAVNLLQGSNPIHPNQRSHDYSDRRVDINRFAERLIKENPTPTK